MTILTVEAKTEDPLMQLLDAESLDDARGIIKRGGYKELGFGYFSTVYKVKDSAIKVSGQDKCWRLFAKYAKSKRSPYLPKIDWINDLTDGFIAKMEMLQPVPWGDPGMKLIGKDPDILMYAMLNFAYFKEPEYKYLLSLFKSKHPKYNRKVQDGKVVDSKYNNHKFVSILNDMEKLNSGCRIDMHFDNIMKRGSQIVILDPIIRTKTYSPGVKQILKNVARMQQDALRAFVKQQGN